MSRLIVVLEVDTDPTLFPAEAFAGDIVAVWEDANKYTVDGGGVTLVAAAWGPTESDRNQAEIERVNRAWDTLGLT